jgi:energy-coupling factor transport system permease protein
MLMGVLPAEAPTGRLARRNPAAKLAATLPPTLVLLFSLDVLTPLVLVLITLAVLPLAQSELPRLLRRSRLLLFAVVMVGVVNAAFAAHPGGHVLFDFGPVHLTSGSTADGLGIGLRALGVALPGVVVLVSIDPVDLADSLVQQLRVPAKFAYGTLAALRLMPLLSEEWDHIAMARRARGVDAGRSPVRLARLFGSQVFALLVVAIRRGTRLATAMDARGFDSGLPRSYARLQVVTGADVVLIVGSILACAVALGVSVGVGSWQSAVSL